MYKLTAADIVAEIDKLGTNRAYDYFSRLNQVKVVHVAKPEGPIVFIRNSARGQIEENIPISSLTKIALVCSSKPNYPIHLDRLFSAGGNTRSALETLLAHTPHFFICYPERTDIYTGEIVRDQKHIMWCPEDTHPLGMIEVKPYTEVIAEVEFEIDFGAISITNDMLGDEFDSIQAKRIHTQMQIALVEIGNALNFHTWIARNDRSIPVKNLKTGVETRLGELPGVIYSLNDVMMFPTYDIRESAALIDCIWFTKDGRRIPAIMEIEHSTGVTSGMVRMKKFLDTAPFISTTFTIIAPNELRNKVITEANQEVFRSLRSRYMPYSTVRELFGLIQRYKLSDVVDHTFVYPFMEQVVDR
jgi:type II restriction enzyme